MAMCDLQSSHIVHEPSPDTKVFFFACISPTLSGCVASDMRGNAARCRVS